MSGPRATSVVLALVAAVALAPPALAVQSQEVTFSAEVNDRDVSQVDANQPLVLSPLRGADVSVLVRNDGSEELRVDSVRLESRVLGLAFVTYTTRVDMVVAPGQEQERQFEIDTGDLAAQATGLLPGTLSLWGSGELVAQEDLAVDVRGSLTSLYGVFGLAVAATTVLLLVAGLYRLATHQLSGNRWLRATRFAVPAAGLGLTLTFTLSALGLLMPSPTASLGFVAAGTAVGLLLGYLTPDPRVSDRSDDDEALLAALLARRDAELAAGSDAVLEPADEPRSLVAEQRVALEDRAPAALEERERPLRAPTTVVVPSPSEHRPPAPRRGDEQRAPLDR